MMEIFRTTDPAAELVRVDQIERGCWINLIAPTQEELDRISHEMEIEPNFLSDPLDDEEKARIDIEDDQTLIIVDVPYVYEDDKIIKFETLPMGMLHVRDDYLITICSKPAAVLERFRNGQIKGLFTYKKTRFIFQILYHVAKDYLKYLKHIDKKTDEIEDQLHKSMKNRELYRLMELGKSLVYFTTSLKSNEAMMERILRGRIVKMYEEDQDLLEDAIVEIKQAIEMSNIYSSIQNSTMDTYASIISNNLNGVMKFLASVTIVLAIPTMVFSYFGQNVVFPYTNLANIAGSFMWLWVLLASVVLSAGTALFLYKKDMF